MPALLTSKVNDSRHSGTNAPGVCSNWFLSRFHWRISITPWSPWLALCHVKADTQTLQVLRLPGLCCARQPAVQPVTQLSNFLLTALAVPSASLRLWRWLEVDEGKVDLVRVDGYGPGRILGLGHAIWRENPSCRDVRFDDVTFGYDDDRTVLANLTLFAKPGQKDYIVSSTGAGKRQPLLTPINPLLRCSCGTITDGIPINDIKKSALRSSLGHCLQDAHLFTGYHHRSNIRFGKLDATDDEVIAALKIANADKVYIRRMPRGYNTVPHLGRRQPFPKVRGSF